MYALIDVRLLWFCVCWLIRDSYMVVLSLVIRVFCMTVFVLVDMYCSVSIMIDSFFLYACIYDIF